MNVTVNQVCETLIYHQYCHNRTLVPAITPDQWRAVYGDMVDELEARYQFNEERDKRVYGYPQTHAVTEMNNPNLPGVCRDCPRLELCLGPQYCEYTDGMLIGDESDEGLCPLCGAVLEEVVGVMGDETAVGVRCPEGCDLTEVFP